MAKTKLSIISALFCFGLLFAEGAFAGDPCSGLSKTQCKNTAICKLQSGDQPDSTYCVSR